MTDKTMFQAFVIAVYYMAMFSFILFAIAFVAVQNREKLVPGEVVSSPELDPKQHKDSPVSHRDSPVNHQESAVSHQDSPPTPVHTSDDASPRHRDSPVLDQEQLASGHESPISHHESSQDHPVPLSHQNSPLSHEKLPASHQGAPPIPDSGGRSDGINKINEPDLQNTQPVSGKSDTNLYAGGDEGGLKRDSGSAEKDEGGDQQTGSGTPIEEGGDAAKARGSADPAREGDQPAVGMPEAAAQSEQTPESEQHGTPTVNVPDGLTLSAPAHPDTQHEERSENNGTSEETRKVPEANSGNPAETEAVEDAPSGDGNPNQGETGSGRPEADQDVTSSDSDDLAIPKKEEEIPSFDEWKARMLREQEKVKSQEAQQVAHNGGEKASASKVKKNRVNCAAASCGAKVLQNNAEAKNAGYILTENRDQYMIQPCSAKKWFVVQLCDPVQVEVLELGNLELFSSLPETFELYVSDRYPTSTWEHLATLRARDERLIQSFTITDAPFAKYIKIEFLSHYGTEHYCPLSTLRLYGLSVHEDTDDESTEAIDDVTVPEQAEEPTNLFDSAKDTVISLVQGVLNGNGNAQDSDDASLSKEIERQVADFAGSVNGTANGTVNGTATTNPCTPDATTGISAERATPPGPCTKPEKPEPVVDSHFTTESETSGAPARHLERPLLPLSVLIRRCNFCERTSKADACVMDRTSVCGYFSFVTYVYRTSCVDHVNAAVHTGGTLGYISLNETGDSQNDTIERLTDTIVISEASDSRQATRDGEKSQVSNTDNVNNAGRTADNTQNDSRQKEETKQHPNEGEIKDSTREQQASNENKQTEATVEIEEPLDLSRVENAQLGTQTLDIPRSATSADTTPKTDLGEPEDTVQPMGSEQEKTSHPGPGSPMLGPDLVQIRPGEVGVRDDAAVRDPGGGVDLTEVGRGDGAESHADTGGERQEQIDPESVSEGDTSAPDTPGTATKDSHAETPGGEEKTAEAKHGDQASNSTKIIQADERSQEVADDYTATSGDDIQVQRLSSGSKETTYMKLKNKIKDLELNLTLSSTYLEELSQRYRKRMEDMYVSLNKTIQKLTNTSKTAEIQDQKQQERIGRLEAVVQDLNGTVMFLSRRLELVHEEVIERHFYLLVVEFAIFLCVMAWCLNRQKDHYRERIRTVSENYFNAATSGVLNTPNPKAAQKGHRRVASMDLNSPSRSPSNSSLPIATTITPGDEGLRKTGSESDITIIEPNRRLFVCPTPNYKLGDVPKKKKKKKSTNQNAAQPTGQHSSQKHFLQSKTTHSVEVEHKSSSSHNNKCVAESPPRKLSTGTTWPKSSPPAVPDLMYHSSANAFSVLTVESPLAENGGKKIANDSRGHESSNVSGVKTHSRDPELSDKAAHVTVKGQGHKGQTSARRRLDVSGVKKSSSVSAEGASCNSNNKLCKENASNGMHAPVAVRNGVCEDQSAVETLRPLENSNPKPYTFNGSLEHIEVSSNSVVNGSDHLGGGYTSVFSEWITRRKKKV